MIRRLTLASFGKFAGASFPFRPVTLFLGDNESGKSTLFDALFEQLCSPKGNSKQGMRLKERYGEKRLASVEFDGAPLDLDPDEFLSLFAIDSGDIKLPMESSASWLDRVKSKLFSGGIDPAALARSLEGEASTQGNRAPAKRLATLERERLAAERELEGLASRRSELIGREEGVRGSSDRLAALERALEAKLAAAKEREALVEERRRIVERESLRSALESLDRLESLRREEERTSGYRGDESGKLLDLERALRAAEEARSRAAARAGLLAERRAVEARKVAELASTNERIARDAALASQLRRSLGRSPTGRPALAVGLVAGAGVLGAIAGALALPRAIASLPAWLGAIAGAVGLLVVALVVLILLGALASAGPRRGGMEAVRDEWRRRAGVGDSGSGASDDVLAASTYEGLVAALAAKERGADELALRLGRERSELEALEGQIRSGSGEIESLDRAAAEAERALSRWLAERGLPSAPAYQAARAEHAALASRVKEAEGEVGKACERLGVRDERALKVEATVRIGKLDALISRPGLSEADARRAEAELAGLRAETEELREEKTRLVASVSGGLGEVKGSLGELPARILECERTLARLAAEARGVEQARSASALAKRIFETMAEDSGLLLAELSGEIASAFAGLVAEERSVELSRFDVESARVVDSGGSMRPLDQLSEGTRDSFLFAARLTLAARSPEGILVLDDPFLSLDAARTRSALRYLAEFQGRTGWQIVIFSKDSGMERMVADRFKEAGVVRLP